MKSTFRASLCYSWWNALFLISGSKFLLLTIYMYVLCGWKQYEPHHKKICLCGFWPTLAQSGLYCVNHRLDCTIYREKTKALISCTVMVRLICAFVFTYAKKWFSQQEKHVSDTIRIKEAVTIMSIFLQLKWNLEKWNMIITFQENTNLWAL